MAQQKQPSPRQQALSALAAAIAAAGMAGGAVLQMTVTVILLRITTRAIATFVAMLAAGASIVFDSGLATVGPAQRIEEEMRAGWLALYLMAAVERLEQALKDGDLEQAEAREEVYFHKHLQAEERRLRSAALVDSTAHLMQTEVLGWHAVIDERTTPECRWANGRNFQADKMPAIGWPGSVHVACRCLAGAPWPGAPMLPSL